MTVVDPTRDVEDALFASGRPWVIGIDEVARGALAGDVGVGACLLLPGTMPAPNGLRDSKMLSEKKRDSLAPELAAWAPAWAVGYATAPEIDLFGINRALALAGARALDQLRDAVQALHLPSGGVILLDGSHNWLGTASGTTPVITRVKADRDCVVVAAASVLAKSARDARMVDLDRQYPEYRWASNKGYGAAVHYDGLSAHGSVPGIHRMSWLPEGTRTRDDVTGATTV